MVLARDVSVSGLYITHARGTRLTNHQVATLAWRDLGKEGLVSYMYTPVMYGVLFVSKIRFDLL